MSPAEALAMIIKMNLTAANYQALRLKAIDQGADIYPSYKRVKKMKKLCLPLNAQYKADEVVFPMDKVLDHHLKRLLDLNPEMLEEIENLAAQHQAKFVFFFKYGADGSGNHSHYRYVDAEDQNNLFISTMTILRLEARFEENGSTVRRTIYENLMPNSPYSISPLRLKFEKETTGNNTNDCVGYKRACRVKMIVWGCIG